MSDEIETEIEEEVLEEELEEEDAEMQGEEAGDEANDETQEEDGEEDGESDEEEGEGELNVIIDGEEQEDQEEDDGKAPEWVRELRKNHRELQKENKRLQQQIESSKSTELEIELGEEPTLSDYEYDEDAFKRAVFDYNERKLKIDELKRQRQQEEQKKEEEWQKKLESYNEAKVKLGARDYAEAEDIVRDSLTTDQQSVIIQLSDKPEVLIYALGKNPKKLEEMADEKDLAKFVYQLGKLEDKLKVTKRKPTTKPEKKPSSNAPVTGGNADKTLDRLRAEAEKTGDYSKVTKYKRQMRQKESA